MGDKNYRYREDTTSCVVFLFGELFRREGLLSFRLKVGRRCRSFGLVLTLPLVGRRTSTGDGCLFLLEPRPSDSEHTKERKKKTKLELSTSKPGGE